MYSLIQKPAPDFTADAVTANNDFTKITLSSFKDKKYVCLFFYPLNFTFVCPSEIIAFSHRIPEFEKRNVQVLGVSVDSRYSHLAWRKTPVDAGGIGEIAFPLISDLSKDIARDYGVLVDDCVALRGTFLIDPKGVLQWMSVNALGVGRSVDEVLRTLQALQTGELCPANWSPGKATLK